MRFIETLALEECPVLPCGKASAGLPYLRLTGLPTKQADDLCSGGRMGNFGDTASPLAVAKTGGRQKRAWAKIPRGLALLAALEFVCVLTGCANDPGQLLIDPGRYTVYKCDDLAKRWKAVSAREKELHDLMAKAGESSAGVVIGAVTYRADYDAVLSDEKLLQRTAVEKNCALPIQAGVTPQPGQPLAGPAPSGQPQSTLYQSDQGIR